MQLAFILSIVICHEPFALIFGVLKQNKYADYFASISVDACLWFCYMHFMKFGQISFTFCAVGKYLFSLREFPSWLSYEKKMSLLDNFLTALVATQNPGFTLSMWYLWSQQLRCVCTAVSHFTDPSGKNLIPAGGISICVWPAAQKVHPAMITTGNCSLFEPSWTVWVQQSRLSTHSWLS